MQNSGLADSEKVGFFRAGYLVGPEKALICLYCYIITAKVQLLSTKKAFSGFTQPGRCSRGRAQRKAFPPLGKRRPR
jgi:hypothetical protein